MKKTTILLSFLISNIFGISHAQSLTDFDGDGVINEVDLDSDNDGILDVDENLTCSNGTEEFTGARILFDENFGEGAPTTNDNVSKNLTYQIGIPQDVNNNDGEYNVATSSYLYTYNYQSAFWASTDQNNYWDGDHITEGRFLCINMKTNSFIDKAIYEQTYIPVISGVEHKMSVKLAKLSTGITPSVKLQILDKDETIIAEITSDDAMFSNIDIWNELEFSFVPNLDVEYVTFRIVNVQSTLGNGNDLGIDNILLKTIECNSDNDTQPNFLDLDSDNDGVFDTIEAGLDPSLDANNDGVVDGGVDENGVPLAVSGGLIASEDNVQSSSDFDGDGVNNEVDLDDDNDGILDADENSVCNSGAEEFTGTRILLDEDFGEGVPTTNNNVSENLTYQIGIPQDVNNNDGEYNVATSTYIYNYGNRGAFWASTDQNNFWDGDHTVEGRFLSINMKTGSLVNEAIYEESNVSVIPGVEHEMSIKLTSLSGFISPSVKLQILDKDETIIAETSSDDAILSNNIDIWNELEFSFVPNSDVEYVNFRIVNTLNTSGPGNDLGIDNILLKTIECNSDSDELPNFLDLDSNNDGVFDTIEAGLDPSLDANNDGIVDGGVDENGVPLAVSGGLIASEDYAQSSLDFDDDGVNNELDLDDDNDGILDADENSVCNSGDEEFTGTRILFDEDFGEGASTANENVSESLTYQIGIPQDVNNNYGEYNVATSTYMYNYGFQSAFWVSTDENNFWDGDHTVEGRFLCINMKTGSFIDKVIYEQTNVPVIPGVEHEMSVKLANLSTGITPSVKLQVLDKNETIIAEATSDDAMLSNIDIWNDLEFSFVPNSGVEYVTIRIVNVQFTLGNGNDLGIDNILLKTLECNLDDDELPNFLDLDSNNDGVFDTIEAGLDPSLDANNDGVVDGGVDENGVPLAVSGGLVVSEINDNEVSDALLRPLVVLGVNDITQNESFGIYPNPASELFTIDFSKSSYTDIKEIIIYDINGNIVKEAQINSAVYQMDISRLLPGVYFISDKADNSLSNSKKLIVK